MKSYFWGIIGLIILVIKMPLMSQVCPLPTGSNVINNGGFETTNAQGGAIGFTTGTHTLFAAGPGQYSHSGLYYVGKNVTEFNYGMSGASAPTIVAPHSGNYMYMVDASPVADAICWEETVTVLPGETYFFSAWITALTSKNRATLQFRVKGNNDLVAQDLGSPVLAPDVATWQQIFNKWVNSSNSTTAVITLTDYNPTGYMNGGNDFAVDDISFINNCTALSNTPPVLFNPTTISLCNNNGAVDLSPIVDPNSKTYKWFLGATDLNKTTNSLTGITQSGTYTVCVDSGTCVNSATVTVVANMQIDGGNYNLCSPASAVLTTEIPNPAGFNIVWSMGGTPIAGETGSTLTVTAPGSYTVTATNGGLCHAGATFTVTSSTSTPVDDIYCISGGKNTANLGVTGTGTTYEWYTTATGGTPIPGVTGKTYTTPVLPGGTQTYYVKDVTITKASVGFADESTLGGNGESSGTEQQIYFTALVNSTLDFVMSKFHFLNTVGGNVVVNLIDPSNNTVIQTVTDNIVPPSAGNLTVKVPIGFSLIAGKKYYLTVVPQVGSNINGLFYPCGCVTYPKTYNNAITFTDAGIPKGWPANFAWQLSIPSSCDRVPVRAIENCPCPPITVGVNNVTNISCFGKKDGIITLSAPSGGVAPYSYRWSNATTTAIPTLSNIDIASNSIFSVVVTDNVGCSTTINSIAITTPSDFDVTNVIDSSTCNQNTGKITLTPVSLLPNLNYQWDVNAGSGITNVASNLLAGIYNVTISDQLNTQCSKLKTYQVFDKVVGNISFSPIIPVSCYNGNDGAITAVLNGAGPGTYVWDNGQPSSATITGLSPITYKVTVTDANGCKIFNQHTLSNPAEVKVTLTPTASPCYQKAMGSLLANPTGGTGAGYTYLWENGKTTALNNSLLAGTYIVTVNDGNGCSATNTAIISEDVKFMNNPPVVFDASCTLPSTGSIQITSSNYPALKYLWSNHNETSATISNLNSGNYTVTISYGLNFACDTSITVFVPNPSAPTIQLDGNIDSSRCCNGGATVAVTPIGAQVSWDTDPIQTNISGIGLCAKTYTVTVTDIATNCTATLPITIPSANSIKIIPTFGNDSCDKGNGYAKVLEVQNNFGWLHYQWSSGVNDTTPSINNKKQGTYRVQVTDEKTFCTKDTIIIIKNIGGIKASISHSPAFASIDNQDINFYDQSMSSTSILKWRWVFDSLGDTVRYKNPIHAFTKEGTYTVKLLVTDLGNCTDTAYDKVIYRPTCVVYVPSAFTPNNDGRNELFVCKGSYIDNATFSMRIYNRWGELIYNSNDLYEGWNGRKNNTGDKIEEMGIYNYKINFKDYLGTKYEYIGGVTLLQ